MLGLGLGMGLVDGSCPAMLAAMTATVMRRSESYRAFIGLVAVRSQKTLKNHGHQCYIHGVCCPTIASLKIVKLVKIFAKESQTLKGQSTVV